MPIITLPDNSQKSFPHPVSVAEVASHIGAGLARALLAGKVNGKLVDSDFLINNDATLQIITAKDPEGVDILRHSCAHLLAQAVKRLFPEAQVTIGPVIEDGFYYDFAYKRPFTLEDIEQIEKIMHAIATEDLKVTHKTVSRNEAIRFFRAMGEYYKAEIIENIPENETLSLYEQGDFIDLCRGPHVPRTGKLTAFKLTKLAGAYWRGDANNAMLQRIYGTAWANKEDLKNYLFRLEEAEKRDHRKIAKNLDLFHTQEDAPGMIFWHPNGWTVYQVMEQYIRQQQNIQGYQEIRTPQLMDRGLWEKSGHWEMYGKNMFTTESENRLYAIKPMSCPAHVQVFKQGLKSYRDLPVRLAEFGCCHRNEVSGALHGLMRVRGFTQDDGHIFCTENQLQSEASHFIDMLFAMYTDFGFKEIIVKLATRPAERIGSDAEWDRAENALQIALDSKKIAWQLAPAEGAFYGPKLEFHLKDCLGRTWQCGTLQVDYCQPERLDASYIAEDGTKRRPVMLHRAVIGTFERFMGILIEHHAGEFPLWLAPVQGIIMTITDEQQDYAKKIADTLKKYGYRVKVDLRNEKIGFKIREHTLKRIPYLLIVGEKEKSQQTVAVRTLRGKDLGSMLITDFMHIMQEKIAQHSQLIEEE